MTRFRFPNGAPQPYDNVTAYLLPINLLTHYRRFPKTHFKRRAYLVFLLVPRGERSGRVIPILCMPNSFSLCL